MATRDEWREQQAAEIALTEWAEQNGHRDDLVRHAIRLGVSKHRIHVLTGIARTTIDRIVDADGGPSEQLLIPHDQALHIAPEYAGVLADLGYGHLLHPCPEGSHDDGGIG